MPTADDGAELLPDDIDPHLWFRADCGGVDYLVRTNPHTQPGRMTAYCPQRRLDYSISQSEIADCSTEARWWIDGFVAGAEPCAPIGADGYEVELDDPDYVAWLEHRKVYLETGRWDPEVPRGPV